MRAAQRIGVAIRIGRVIAIDIVGVVSGKAELTGAILLLGNAVLGLSNRLPRAIKFYKAVLVVDVGSRNYGYGSVIITWILTAGILHSIGEFVHTVHLHIGRRVAHYAVFRHGRIRQYCCLTVLTHKLVRCKRCIGVTGYSSVRFFCTDIHQYTLVIEHIVAHDMDIHRQAIVNDDRIRNSLNGIRHSEPDDRMGVVVTVCTYS